MRMLLSIVIGRSTLWTERQESYQRPLWSLPRRRPRARPLQALTCSPSSSLPGGERELLADEVLDPLLSRQREPAGVSLRAHLDRELKEWAAPALQRHPFGEERQAHALQLDSERQAAVAFARLRNGGPQGLRELAVTLALIGG